MKSLYASVPKKAVADQAEMFSKYQLICFIIGTFYWILWAIMGLSGKKTSKNTLTWSQFHTLKFSIGALWQISDFFCKLLHFWQYWAVMEKLGVFDKVKHFCQNQTNFCPYWICWIDSWVGGWKRGGTDYKSRTLSRKIIFQF